MPSFQQDQAAGLRRMMTSRQSKIVTILSANVAENQPLLLTNLAASISEHQSDVLVMHAAQDTREILRQYEIENLHSLQEVAIQKYALAQSVKNSKFGFSITKLLPKNHKNSALYNSADKRLNTIFKQLAGLYEVVLVDATLNKQHLLPLTALNENEILIQLTPDPESIKQAYSLIKQVCSQIGRRSFGIIVSSADDAQAAVVFRSISQVAKNFMQIELEFFGAIPADEHLARSAKLGRAVIDAFPLAKASKAFKTLAQRISYKQDQLTEFELASFT